METLTIFVILIVYILDIASAIKAKRNKDYFGALWYLGWGIFMYLALIMWEI